MGESIRMAEPIRPTTTAVSSMRVSAPWRTGSSPPARSATRSSVRIAVLLIAQVLAQGFQGAVHRYLHRGFRHAGALGGFRHRDTVELDVFHQLTLGGRQSV